MRLGAAFLIIGLLAGCLSSPQVTRVAGGNVAITGPTGYCIDRATASGVPNSNVVMMASCAALDQSVAAPHPSAPAVLVASVSSPERSVPVAQSLPALKTFFRSDLGRASLSKSGRPESVRILGVSSHQDVLILHARDRSSELADSLQDEYWRALFDLDGRTISATVYATRSRPISADTGKTLLLNFVNQIRAANS